MSDTAWTAFQTTSTIKNNSDIPISNNTMTHIKGKIGNHLHERITGAKRKNKIRTRDIDSKDDSVSLLFELDLRQKGRRPMVRQESDISESRIHIRLPQNQQLFRQGTAVEARFAKWPRQKMCVQFNPRTLIHTPERKDRKFRVSYDEILRQLRTFLRHCLRSSFNTAENAIRLLRCDEWAFFLAARIKQKEEKTRLFLFYYFY